MLVNSFLFRISQILASTAFLCLVLMSLTMLFQGQTTVATRYGLLAGGALIWLAIMRLVIRKKDPELVLEVARFLYPLGMLGSLAVAIFLGWDLSRYVPEGGHQEWVIYLVGAGAVMVLLVRSFDMRFMRSAAEMPHMNRR